MWLIPGQLSIKAEWRDAPIALPDFSWSNKQKLSANVAIGLHSHPRFHQSILATLSCSDYQNVFSIHISSKKDFLLHVMT